MLATRVTRITLAAFAALVPCIAQAAPSAGVQLQSPSPSLKSAESPSSTATAAPSPSPDPSAAAAAGASLVDYYTADRSAAPEHDQLELRLRDDGRAWLVTAPAPAASAAPAATPAPGRFETGTWHAASSGVTVALDSVASVVGGRPLDPQPETRTLTFAFAPCGLTLVAAAPTPADLGPRGIAFAKRHCR